MCCLSVPMCFAAVVLFIGCSEQSAILLTIEGATAMPPLSVPEHVDKLSISVNSYSEGSVSRDFPLAGMSRVLWESVTLISGADDDAGITIEVAGLHADQTIARGTLTTAFKSGATIAQTVTLDWLETACLDSDGDLWGVGPACRGADCDDNNPAVTSCDTVCDPACKVDYACEKNVCVPECPDGFSAVVRKDAAWCLSGVKRGTCCAAVAECTRLSALVGWATGTHIQEPPEEPVEKPSLVLSTTFGGICAAACLTFLGPTNPRLLDCSIGNCRTACDPDCSPVPTCELERCWTCGCQLQYWCHIPR